MKDFRLLRKLVYGLMGITLTLTSCGGGGGGIPPRATGVGQVNTVNGVSGRTEVLKSISITPNDPLGVHSGTRFQFTAMGSYSDNSVQDLTTQVVWTSSDTSITTISNEPDSKGLAIAVSRGYCSISAALGNISGSTAMGVN